MSDPPRKVRPEARQLLYDVQSSADSALGRPAELLGGVVLAQCMDRYSHQGPIDLGEVDAISELVDFPLCYPVRGLIAKIQRLRSCPALLVQLMVLSPLVLLGSIATGLGVSRERRPEHYRTRRTKY